MICVTCGTSYCIRETGVGVATVAPAVNDTPEKILRLASGDLYECITCGHQIVKAIGENYAFEQEAKSGVENLTKFGVTIVKRLVVR